MDKHVQLADTLREGNAVGRIWKVDSVDAAGAGAVRYEFELATACLLRPFFTRDDLKACVLLIERARNSILGRQQETNAAAPEPALGLDWLFLGKRRHRVQEFVALDLKVKLLRVRLSRRNYAYEVELLVRKKISWKKVGKIRLSDADRFIRLLHEADAYANKIA